MTSDLLNAPQEFLRLFKAGKDAARQGDNAQAHALFRRAIEVDPYHEQVWLWLASVVETDEDRRVCFENVLELNPGNTTARARLRHLDDRAIHDAFHPHTKDRRRSARARFLLVLLSILFLVLVALIAAAILNLP